MFFSQIQPNNYKSEEGQRKSEKEEERGKKKEGLKEKGENKGKDNQKPREFHILSQTAIINPNLSSNTPKFCQG